MMNKAILYSLFLFTLVASCNKAAYKPKEYNKERITEVNAQEKYSSEIVPVPHEARQPIIDKYIQFTFGRGVSEPNDSGDTPLMEAVKKGDEQSMFMLLEHPGIELDQRSSNNYGNTVLRCAIKAPSLNIKNINMLLDKGIDVNAKDQYGWTALHEAAQEGHENIVQTLLDNGAEVNAKNKYGSTALHDAVRFGRGTIVQTLLDNGAEVNAKNKYGETALHKAAQEGHDNIVQTILDNGAEVNAKNKYGETALYWAAKFGRYDIVRTLIDKGADVNAIRHRYDDCIPLLDKGVRVNKKPDTGGTALSAAISNGHQEVTKLLRDAGAR